MYNSIMTIFLASYKPGICHILSKKLSSHKCYIFSDLDILTQMLQNLTTPPDLLVMDFLCFNHDLFNIFDEMKRRFMYVPLIFYNDPTPTLPTRVMHWKYMINYQKPCTSEFEFTEELENILEQIQELVESEELSPYIPLMQQPKPLPKSFFENDDFKWMNNEHQEERISYIKSKLTQNQLFLFNIFYENTNTFLKKTQIIKEYKKRHKMMSKDSLIVVISRLKKKIIEVSDGKFTIEKCKNGYRLIKINDFYESYIEN